MAPAQSKLAGIKRTLYVDDEASEDGFFDSAMTKIAKGTAVFADDYVDAMADGKTKGLPKNMDDIVVDIDKDKENVKEPRCTKKPKAYTPLDAQDVLLCPQCANRNVFAMFDDASYYSDGNVKHYNIGCQGTDASPCSFCDSEGDKTPSPKKGSEFVEPAGFDIEQFVGEEPTPKKMPADVPVCKWCHLAPCIVENKEARAEGEWIVDSLNEELSKGLHVPLRNYRYALYRMCARRLGHKGKGIRVVLPVCVQSFVDKNFVEKDEVRTGFKEATT